VGQSFELLLSSGCVTHLYGNNSIQPRRGEAY
jgi:hypothetical protein